MEYERPLPLDDSGCQREDCPRALNCWRFVGAKLRTEDGWYSLFDPENCDSFIEIQWH